MQIIKMCADKKVEGYLAAHSVPNLFYILRKDLSVDDRRAALMNLCDILKVVSMDAAKIISALQNSEFSDLEDCLQDECASEIKADYIITRNTKDFGNSSVAAILPDEFLNVMGTLS